MVDFTIPPEAVEAVAWYLWKNGYTPHRDISEKVARAALLAALRAWPGAYDGASAGVMYRSLPMQENTDGK